MEQKKSNEANLEKKRFAFFSIGLLMISSVTFSAFEYKQGEAIENNQEVAQNNLDDDFLEDILPEEEPPPPPPEETPPPPPPQIEDITITEDEDEVTEIDFNTEDVLDEIPEPQVAAPEPEEIFDFAEVEPAFPGGEAAMAQWINDNIEYPTVSAEMGEQGIVYVQFVVQKDGSIKNVKVLKGVSTDLDNEAKRVVSKMPKWSPGEQAGKKVSVRYTLPIHFRLG